MMLPAIGNLRPLHQTTCPGQKRSALINRMRFARTTLKD